MHDEAGHHLEVVVKLDGETVAGVDRVVRRYSVDTWNGLMDETRIDDTFARKVPSGEHSILVDWNDAIDAGKLLSQDRDIP